MKIATKTSLAFLAAVVICTAPALFFLYLSAKNDLHRSIEAHLLAITEAQEDQIQSYLAMLKTSVNQLAQSIVLDNFLKIAGQTNIQQCKEFAPAMTRLSRTKQANPAIYEFLLLDKTGRVIASSDTNSIGADKSTDSYFREGQKRIYVKDAYYLEGQDEPLMAVAVPCLDQSSGTFSGVLVARVKLNDLWKITSQRTGLGQTGENIIINKQKVMITPSRYFKNTVLRQKVDTGLVRQGFLYQQTKFVPNVFADYRGVKVLGASGYIPEMQWVIVTKIDAQEAFVHLNRLRWLFVLILLITGLATWLLSRVLAKLLVAPIMKLHEGIEFIGAGNIDYKVATDAPDEIGDLTRAFNAMTAKLKNTTTSLETLNQEITARKLTEEKLRQRTGELFEREEDLTITLRSIGDALIATDNTGRVTRMNPVAEHLTGWSLAEATGKPLADIFHIINAQTRVPVENPTAKVLASGQTVGLANHTALIARDGTVRQIADSAAPIRDAQGSIRGMVLVFHDVSDEYRIKAVLREQTEKLEGFFNVALDLLCIADLQGNFIRINRAWENILGYSVAELERRKFLDFVHPDDMPATLDAIAQLGQGDQVLNFVNRYRCKDGNYRFIEWRSVPHGDLIYAAARDITARKLMEDALRKMSQAIEQNPAIVVITDPTGKIEYVNPKFCAVTGYTAAEACGQNPRILKSGEFSGEQYKQLWATITAGREWRGIFHNKKKNGTLYWESALIAPITGRNGQITNFLAIKEDITENKRVQDELVRSKEQFDLAVNGSRDGIWDWDLRNNKLYLSPRWKQIIGYNDDELPNAYASFAERIHPEDKPRVLEYIDRYLANQIEFYTIEFRFRHRDGSFRWILARGAALRDQNGKPYRMAGSHTDITARKESEEMLRKSKADLEQAYQQLNKAFERESRLTVQANAASVAKSQFVANISHEIRTPLNGIIGLCELLLDTKMTKEQLEYAQTINSSAEVLLNIINTTLDFAKIDAGKMDLEKVNFNLRDFLEKICAILDVNAAKKNLALTISIDPHVPVDLNGDPHRLRQVFINLIGNAIKFTAKGKIEVKAELADAHAFAGHAHAAPGNTAGAPVVPLRFAVRDTGIGIPVDRREQLFNPFFQVDASMARKFGGTGLGLTISKSIIEKMGGTIGVESIEGQGSTFWFTIPFAKQRAGDQPAQSVDAAQHHERYQPGKQLHILVAEDNTTNQMVIAGILKKMGYTIATVANGAEAVKALEAAHYDLVLMDIQMPEMDGLQATAIIRDPKSKIKNKRIPILALTAHVMEEDRAKCLAAGMNGYITKPVSMPAVAAAIAGIVFPMNAELPARGPGPSRQKPKTAAGAEAGRSASARPAQNAIMPPMTPSVVFDSKALADRLAGDRNMLGEVINMFLQETPKGIGALADAIKTQHPAQATHWAHTIKGSAANLGGNRLRAVAARMEGACKAADWHEAQVLLPRLNKQFEFLERALHNFVKT